MSSRSSSGLTLLAFTTSYTMALTADDSTKLSPPPPPPLPPPPPPTSSSQHYNFFCLSQIVSNLAIQLSDSIKSHDATTTHIVRRGKTTGSAVAMSLLYGITGVIAIMFLVLVTSGAVRAHRYPELYGPRAAFGLNNGQSRVRGLARAVLETLPVYKFGDPEPGKPDPNRDIEAEAESTANEQIERPAAAHVNGGRPTTAIPLQTRPASSGDADNKPLVAEVMRQRPATASGAQDGGAVALDKEICPDGTRETASTSAGGPEADSTDNHLECSICTEEFVVGDDVRVLPCNHKFHPGCVDTWLVNISGTCPLCRLDLTHRKNRPRNRNSSNSLNSIASHDTHTTEFAPPLDLEFPALGMYSYDNHTPGNRANRTSTSSATVTTTQDSNSNRHSRRTSRFFDMQHRLRSAQTMEERIQLLRQLRNRPVQTSNEMTEVVIAGEQTDSRRGRHEARMSLTDRLRDRFLVRTQTQTQEDTRPVTATLAGPSTWREREGE